MLKLKHIYEGAGELSAAYEVSVTEEYSTFRRKLYNSSRPH